MTDIPKKTRKKSVNLTIRSDIIRQAKELNLNASEAAEAGILAAVKKRQEERWLAENAAAIAAYNDLIDREGVAVQAYWLRELDGEV